MAHLLNTQAMWDFQHAPSRVVGGHPSQHVQQMKDGGPQPIGLGSDTMLEMGLGLMLSILLLMTRNYPRRLEDSYSYYSSTTREDLKTHIPTTALSSIFFF
jgi:hypothetical protein